VQNEFQNLYSLLHIMIIKSRWLRCAWHVAWIEVCRILANFNWET